jgi:hypothetical protein
LAGWEVTGFDISDADNEQGAARKLAGRGLKIEARGEVRHGRLGMGKCPVP